MVDRKTLAQAAISRMIELPPDPELPEGYHLELPGRGTTFVAEVPGPSDDAPTLFLLHGLACTAYLNWFPAIGELRKRYRLVMMDMRGHGRGIPSGRFFRLSDCADDAVAVADALGLERFIPVGYSMGGPVAQLVWHRHPERVRGMVLAATARNFRGKPQERFFFLLLPSVILAMSLRGNTEPVARALTELSDDQQLSDLDLPAWCWAEFRRTSPWTIFQGINAIGQFSSHRWIGKIDVPTAVVVTTRDRFVPAGRQIRLAQDIPGASMHAFPGNHAACVMESRKFVPALLDACESVANRLD